MGMDVGVPGAPQHQHTCAQHVAVSASPAMISQYATYHRHGALIARHMAALSAKVVSMLSTCWTKVKWPSLRNA
ncbi:hypothetical protein A7K61_23505 [Pseudomonas sp. AP42]|nr:hypothetical protein A7K61_23505 [Pseudomonas sp. AP42]